MLMANRMSDRRVLPLGRYLTPWFPPAAPLPDREKGSVQVFCGIDWAERHHDVAIVDNDGRLVAKRRISDDVAGFGELVVMLAEAGETAAAPIPVAIETGRGLLVAALRATGRPVYSINPMAVARYRERRTVARSKSD